MGTRIKSHKHTFTFRYGVEKAKETKKENKSNETKTKTQNRITTPFCGTEKNYLENFDLNEEGVDAFRCEIWWLETYPRSLSFRSHA